MAQASGVNVHFALKQNEPKVQEKTKLPRSLCGLRCYRIAVPLKRNENQSK
tara:strand:+ start:1163 stop:1315 length:153 start_codon:yes stop_codon:yes gene_type:complete